MRQITVDMLLAKEHVTQYSYVARDNTLIINGPVYIRKTFFPGHAPKELQLVIVVEK